MISFNYSKMSGAGNTFIVVDGKELPEGIDLAALAPVVCSDSLEHGGADGFIAIDRWEGGDFEMRYYNRDGSTGMMCGNGGRCAVRFAFDHGYIADGGNIGFINAGVAYRAAMTEHGVKVWFPEPREFRFGFEIDLLGGLRRSHFADVGTPHAVLFMDEIGEPAPRQVAGLDLNTWGPPLRRHAAFGPAGANANFVEVSSDGSGILLRTFERGVEAETGACGTGAISSAIIASRLRDLSTPVSVTTSSGKTLRVDFRIDGDRVRDVSLEGDAEVVIRDVRLAIDDLQGIQN